MSPRLVRNPSTETLWTDLTQLAIKTIDSGSATAGADSKTFAHYTVKCLSESTHTQLYTLKDAADVEREIAAEKEMMRRPNMLLEAERRAKARKAEAKRVKEAGKAGTAGEV
jgi:hypothetical protein